MRYFGCLLLCVALLVMTMPCKEGLASTAVDTVPQSYVLSANRVGNLSLTEATGIREIQAAFGIANVRTEPRIREGMEEILVLVYIEGTEGVPSIEGVLTGKEKILSGGLNVMDRRFVTDKGIRIGASVAELKKAYRLDDFAVGGGAVNARSEEAQMSFVLSAVDPMNVPDLAIVKKIRVWIP